MERKLIVQIWCASICFNFPAVYVMLSNSDALILLVIADGWASPNLNTLSITDSSVLVVSSPQNETQSFTTIPAPTTSLPLLTVPATRGTCNSDDNSSWSSTAVLGWTYKKSLNSLPPVAYNDHIYKYQNIYFDQVDSTLYFQHPCPRNNHFYIGWHFFWNSCNIKLTKEY